MSSNSNEFQTGLEIAIVDQGFHILRSWTPPTWWVGGRFQNHPNHKAVFQNWSSNTPFGIQHLILFLNSLFKKSTKSWYVFFWGSYEFPSFPLKLTCTLYRTLLHVDNFPLKPKNCLTFWLVDPLRVGGGSASGILRLVELAKFCAPSVGSNLNFFIENLLLRDISILDAYFSTSWCFFSHLFEKYAQAKLDHSPGIGVKKNMS